jgi:hypothetical protein
MALTCRTNNSDTSRPRLHFEALRLGSHRSVAETEKHSISIFTSFQFPFLKPLTHIEQASGSFYTNLRLGKLETGNASYRFQFPFPHGCAFYSFSGAWKSEMATTQHRVKYLPPHLVPANFIWRNCISLLFVTISILIVRVISSKCRFGVTISIVIATAVSKALGKWVWKAHICDSDCVMYVARITAT